MTENLPPVDPQQENDPAQPADEFSWLDGESEEEYVSRINKDTGRNFKNVGDIVKNIQNADKKITELSRKVEEAPKSQTSPDDLEELFFGSNSKAELVKDKLKTVAKNLYDGSVLKAWNNEEWMRDMADSLDREAKRKAADAKKVLSPSGQPSGQKDYLSMDDEEILNLPPDEAEKAFKAKVGK